MIKLNFLRKNIVLKIFLYMYMYIYLYIAIYLIYISIYLSICIFYFYVSTFVQSGVPNRTDATQLFLNARGSRVGLEQ